ncbi:MAG: hypothetical protein RIR26_449 [Pseudomonadota bacterium]|jgi:hypothetical protein
MNSDTVALLLDKTLGQSQHHACLLVSRSFADQPTPIALVAELLFRLAGLSLFESSSLPSPDAFWEAFKRHPDLLRADPDRAILRKDDVELFRERALYPATFARRRFLLVERAERLNNQSANALLKTLEEPQAECVFVLTTARPSALPSTIASRCQKVLLPAWDTPARASDQLEREDRVFLENIFCAPHLKTDPQIFPSETLFARQKIQMTAQSISELAQWSDQAGRRYDAELLRDALVENTSAALRSGELSQTRASSLLALLSVWAETDPLNPTNSFWLMRVLLTLAN